LQFELDGIQSGQRRIRIAAGDGNPIDDEKHRRALKLIDETDHAAVSAGDLQADRDPAQAFARGLVRVELGARDLDRAGVRNAAELGQKLRAGFGVVGDAGGHQFLNLLLAEREALVEERKLAILRAQAGKLCAGKRELLLGGGLRGRARREKPGKPASAIAQAMAPTIKLRRRWVISFASRARKGWSLRAESSAAVDHRDRSHSTELCRARRRSRARRVPARSRRSS